MNKIISKLQNFWFYYKVHLLIGLAALCVVCYLSVQSAASVEADYHIGLVQAVPFPEEALARLETVIAAAGEDCNQDGQVVVQIHTYYVDLADDSPNAGVNNAQTIAALDADLVGRTSGIFLLEDVDTFRSVTGTIFSDPEILFDEALFLVLRSDAEQAYVALAERLS